MRLALLVLGGTVVAMAHAPGPAAVAARQTSDFSGTCQVQDNSCQITSPSEVSGLVLSCTASGPDDGTGNSGVKNCSADGNDCAGSQDGCAGRGVLTTHTDKPSHLGMQLARVVLGSDLQLTLDRYKLAIVWWESSNSANDVSVDRC
ncbi:hypothetical protein VTK73DRAFT_6646 [Phialemonium thermophilum]|uniref:Uncharacterized protein n=1 Tax=Phialemonium thermophilum TaxID=223376 RepID=A0ABR3WIL8_9PEZI